MSKKTIKQLDALLNTVRIELGEEQDKLEQLERAYREGVSILDGSQLSKLEEGITTQRLFVKAKQELVDEIKQDKLDLSDTKANADTFKWKEVEPLLRNVSEELHISYNVETNKFIYCMDMADKPSAVVNPVFRTFDASRAPNVLGKLIDHHLPDAGFQINKFYQFNHSHYQETASFMGDKWGKTKVYNKARVISKFWTEPDFARADEYNKDFDLLMYCVGGGKQENIDHLEQWPVYKYLYPERVGNTPNLDCGGKPGGNGKGRYGELCRTIFTHGCVVPAAAKELADGFNANWELATILLFDEPTEKELPANKLKQATGGEEQRVERKGVDAYTADRNFSVLALSNNTHGVFKLSGTGSGGEDRRYSVMATTIVMIDEVMRLEGITKDEAAIRVNGIAQLVKSREEVAKWMAHVIYKHNLQDMQHLHPLHGEDYRNRFEDQKSTYDVIFDQLMPVFMQTGVISVNILNDIVTVLHPIAKRPPRVVKDLFASYLAINKIEFNTQSQTRVDVKWQGKQHMSHQSFVFRLKDDAKDFEWSLISTSIPCRVEELSTVDLLITV